MTDKKKTAPTGLTLNDCEIIKPKLGGSKVIVTVRCPIKKPDQALQAIKVLGSIELKNHVYDVRGELGLADYGIEKFGAHRPYTDQVVEPGQRVGEDSEIKGYEQDFRFTRRA